MIRNHRMVVRTFLAAAMAVGTLSSLACGGNTTGTAPDPMGQVDVPDPMGQVDVPDPMGQVDVPQQLTPRPGYVIGRATFADGRPVPKLEVAVGGFEGGGVIVNGGIPTVGFEEGTDGRYAVQTKDAFSRKNPVDARVVTIKATALISHVGKTFKLPMHPVDGKADTTDNGAFIGQSGTGIVRDFVLRLSGPRPGYEGPVAEELISTDALSPLAFYGAIIKIDLSYKSEGGYESDRRVVYPQGSTVAVTLTPDGPLADGSQGKVITRRVPPGKDANYSFALHDIPIGVYTATAQVIDADGTTRPLRVNTQTRDFQPSTRIEFAPASYGTGSTDLLSLYIGR